MHDLIIYYCALATKMCQGVEVGKHKPKEVEALEVGESSLKNEYIRLTIRAFNVQLRLM